MGSSRVGKSCRWIGNQLAKTAAQAVTKVGTGVAAASYASLQIIRGSNDFPQKNPIKEDIASMGSIADLAMNSAAIVDNMVFLARYGSRLDKKEIACLVGSVLLCTGSNVYTALYVETPNQTGTAAICAVASAQIANTAKYIMWKKHVANTEHHDAQASLKQALRPTV